VEDLGGARVVLGGQVGDGAANEIGLDIGAELVQLRDLLERERRDDRTPMWVEGDETLGLELAERFTDGNPADAELGTDRVLSERASLGVVAAKDAFADRVGRHAGEGLTAEREQDEV